MKLGLVHSLVRPTVFPTHLFSSAVLDYAYVTAAMEHGADSGWTPLLLRRRGRRYACEVFAQLVLVPLVTVKRLSNAGESIPVGVHPEDIAHDVGLHLVDLHVGV